MAGRFKFLLFGSHKHEEFDMARNENVPFVYRFKKWRQYEYIARLARDQGHNLLRRAMDNLLFSSGWEDRLTTLRDAQRKFGIPDEVFYSVPQKKFLGIAATKFGRHTANVEHHKKKRKIA